MSNEINRQDALKNFGRARVQAKRAELAARITGRDYRQVPFDVVRDELRLDNAMYKGVQQINLDMIVGSIGRYDDFTRTFLPLKDVIKERWVGVESLASTRGWPPIDLFQVGNIYFVKDGNHRTAVARQMGNKTIEAHVWAYPDDIQFDPEDDVDDILIKVGEEAFMRQTALDEIVPAHQIKFTSPGRYTELRAQIAYYRKRIAQLDGEEPSMAYVVAFWHDYYLSVVQIINESTLMAHFPGRTEADLFVWMLSRQATLKDQYGDYSNLAELANILVEEYAEKPVDRVSRQVRNFLGGDELPPLDI